MAGEQTPHPSRTESPLAAADLRLAPVALHRVCGIPVSALDELSAPRTLDLIRRANQNADVAAARAAELSARLHTCVRHAGDDRDLRRALLAIRRAVHRGAWTDRHRAAAESVRAKLDPRTETGLRSWIDATESKSRHLDAAETAIMAELRAAAQAMTTRLRDPENLRGLALASPDFGRALLGGPEVGDGRVASRFARTATSYFTRIATRTVPFSTFVTVGLTAVGPTFLPRQTGERSVVTSTRTLAVALLIACTRHPDTARLLEVVRNRGLRCVNGRWVAVLPVYVPLADGAGFRYDELTDCDSYRGTIACLPEHPTPLPELVATSGPGVTESTARRLVEVGLLQPRTPWALDAPRPLGAFAERVRTTIDTPSATPPTGLADALETLAASENSVAYGDAASRIAAIGSARHVAREAFAVLGQPAPRWLDSAPLFHEAVATSRPALRRLPEPVRADLLDVAARTVPQLRWSVVYDELARFFVAHYGTGGSCSDILEFLYSFDPGTSFSGDPDRCVADSERARLPPAAVAVFFQLAAAGEDDLAAANYRLVVNAVHPGELGFLTRWAHVPALRTGLSAAIREWTAALHPGSRVYQFCAYPDFVELQRPARTALPLLRWPTDLPAFGDNGIELSRLTLNHDPRSGMLRIYDSDGSPVSLCYTGTVPSGLLTGPIRLLSILANPWRPPAGGLVEQLGPAGHSPRVTCQRIVWARARWVFSAADVPAYTPGAPLVPFLTSIDRWRRAAGLPDQVFVKRTRGSRPVGKPRWVGFHHPHTIVTGFRNLLAEATHLAVTEALPATGQHWARNGAGEPVATEFVALASHG
ncbi:lantibiotic dehydratase [Fodinicola acaciae]|uniref:lantibiotic dehydratase n=1 Tax=Fodinicola acaciae TaxID=2681555 RepID=UPI0013D2BC52|nr:lantibiotic dehydratase [Fodinicola acaciae]